MNQFNSTDPHKQQPVLFAGEKIENAVAAMIMVHGRGATAESILSLADEFSVKDGFIFAAPQAENNTWYPYSFLAPQEMNEPEITSGLNSIKNLIDYFIKNGIPLERLIILGFSQGACLALEFAAKNPQKYGGIVGLSGGLIGENLEEKNYSGNLLSTPVFLGCSNIDPHIPLERVNQTENIFSNLGAKVIKQIYKDMGHTINNDELFHIEKIINGFNV